MERNVVSLETAKKLKAAGFPQTTERFWRRSYSISELGQAHEDYGKPDVAQHQFNIGDWVIKGDFRREVSLAVVRWYDKDVNELGRGQIAAPTAQEIVDQLPMQVDKDHKGGSYTLGVFSQREHPDGESPWVWNARYGDAYGGGYDTIAPTMPEALAGLWLKLST